MAHSTALNGCLQIGSQCGHDAMQKEQGPGMLSLPPKNENIFERKAILALFLAIKLKY